MTKIAAAPESLSNDPASPKAVGFWAGVRADVREIRDQRRARNAEDPGRARLRKTVGLVGGAAVVATTLYGLRQGWHLPPVAVGPISTKPNVASSRAASDKLTTLAHTMHASGPSRLEVKTRGQLAKAHHGEGNSPERRTSRLGKMLTATMLAPAILHGVDVAPAATVPSPGVARLEGSDSVQLLQKRQAPQRAEQPIARTAGSGDGVERWAHELLSEGGVPLPRQTSQEVKDISNDIIGANPAIAGDPAHWMQERGVYDVTAATHHVTRFTKQ